MSQIVPGELARPFYLPAIDGSYVDVASLRGKRVLIAFMRFATCPFCNLRIRELVTRYSELAPGFTIVAIFDSPLDHLRRSVEGHHAPFKILADATNDAYQTYSIPHSLAGMLKGTIFRLPSLLKAMLIHGYIPTPIRGSVTIMPADFLVDEFGLVHRAYYGTDEGDHLPFGEIKTFANAR